MIILSVFEIANQLLIRIYVTRFISRNSFEVMNDWLRRRSLFPVASCMSSAFVKHIHRASNDTLPNNDEKLSSERLLSFTNDNVEKILEAEENKNTRRNTDRDVALANLNS